MRKDKEEAVKLRTNGKSYNEIKALLGVPKSTLSEWFRNQKWSNDIAEKCANNYLERSKIRLASLNKTRGELLKKAYEEAEIEAFDDYQELKFHPLFISGLMIYWGEGNKLSKHRVFIANSDPKMIQIFCLFLTDICGIDNLRAWILIYPDLDEKKCKEHWIRNTMLKNKNFTKSMTIKGKTTNKRLEYGVCNVGVSGAYLKRKINVWLDLLSNDIISQKYLSAGIV